MLRRSRVSLLCTYARTLGTSSLVGGLTTVSQSGCFGAPTISSPILFVVDGILRIALQGGSCRKIISNLFLSSDSIASTCNAIHYFLRGFPPSSYVSTVRVCPTVSSMHTYLGIFSSDPLGIVAVAPERTRAVCCGVMFSAVGAACQVRAGLVCSSGWNGRFGFEVSLAQSACMMMCLRLVRPSAVAAAQLGCLAPSDCVAPTPASLTEGSTRIGGCSAYVACSLPSTTLNHHIQWIQWKSSGNPVEIHQTSTGF